MSSRYTSGNAAALAEGYLRQSPMREVIPISPAASFRYFTHDYPYPFASWGYHPEYEVHLILKTSGRYVIGDVIDSFEPGQLMLVGPNLPHHWISDLPDRQVVRDRDAVLHFSDTWIRACQAAMPELSALDALLTRSAHGIEFLDGCAERGAAALLRVGEAETELERVIRVLDLLTILAQAQPHETATVTEWLPHGDPGASTLVGSAIDYILDNLTSEVRLSEAARLAAMSESAFSRRFKQISGHTFTDLVRQLRLGRACRLLERTDDSIAAIAAAVGYRNLSNFNRQFRQHYGVTPRHFRHSAREAATTALRAGAAAAGG